MTDPVRIGNAVFDLDEIAAILPREHDTLIFLRGGKSVGIDEVLTPKQVEDILEKDS